LARIVGNCCGRRQKKGKKSGLSSEAPSGNQEIDGDAGEDRRADQLLCRKALKQAALAAADQRVMIRP
jgi:hypothetical protein